MKIRFRILHCLRAPVGGLFRHVCDLSAAQHARGHSVGVVCADDGNALTSERLARLEPVLQLGLHRLPMRRDVGLGDALAAREVRRLAGQLDIDILHGHGAKGGAYARLAARALRRGPDAPRCYYTPHGGSLHYGRETLKGRVYAAAERWLAGATDGLIFESAYSLARFDTLVGPVAAPRRVIPNGVLDADFAPIAPAPDAAGLLFVGELRHLKGVDVLIDALAALHREGPLRPRLVVVGDGPDAAQFRRRVEEHGLSEAITFPGAMPARRAFTLGRLLVVPSRAESFPYIVLEAAAAALPMIATDVGGIPEIVADTPVQLVPAGDVAALATAMVGRLGAPVQAAADARVLQQRTRERFTIDRMADAILDFYFDPRS